MCHKNKPNLSVFCYIYICKYICVYVCVCGIIGINLVSLATTFFRQFESQMQWRRRGSHTCQHTHTHTHTLPLSFSLSLSLHLYLPPSLFIYIYIYIYIYIRVPCLERKNFFFLFATSSFDLSTQANTSISVSGNAPLLLIPAALHFDNNVDKNEINKNE